MYFPFLCVCFLDPSADIVLGGFGHSLPVASLELPSGERPNLGKEEDWASTKRGLLM